MDSKSAGFFLIVLLTWGTTSTWCDTLIKSALFTFPFPITITLIIFGVSSMCGYVLLYLLRIRPYQNAHQLIGIRSFFVVTMCQMFGFLFTYGSYGKVDVSFTQTIKASAPLFSLGISVFVFRERFTSSVYQSMIPIVLGVFMTSMFDMSFDVLGLLFAFGSNVCFTSRSIVGKKYMKVVDSANLYHYMCVTSFMALLPLWFITDGLMFVRSPTLFFEGSGGGVMYKILFGSINHWMYNMISLWVLSQVAPLTHAVLNVLRRVLVIVCTTVYFGRSPSWENVLGICCVFSGVLWYSKARSESSQQKRVE